MLVLQYLDGDGDDYGGDCGDDGTGRHGDNDGVYGGGGDPETLMPGMTIALLVYLQTLPWCNGQLQCRSSEY